MADKLDKLFGGLNMSWPRVLIFALCAGVYTGIIGIIPQLEPTSLHDICVTTEIWVVFAFVIATNCEKNWEAALKIFVFFVVSQPVIFGIEVIAGLDFDMAMYYYTTNWGPKTLFTLPGGFIAFYIKKQNWLGAIILGLGCALQGILAVCYVDLLIKNPPFHLLTILLCIASIIVFTLFIQKENKHRICCLCIAGLATLLVIAYFLAHNGVLS